MPDTAVTDKEVARQCLEPHPGDVTDIPVAWSPAAPLRTAWKTLLGAPNCSWIMLRNGVKNGVERIRSCKDVQKWYHQMDTSTTYEAWLEAARKLDEYEGHDAWKKIDDSPLYDAELIRERVEEMQRLEQIKDIQGIMFHLRSGLVRGLGGVGNHKLHTHAYVGTKRLIEEHTAQVLRLLRVLQDAPEAELRLEKKLAFFAESRHALGKTALLLSGGASLGMYHFGVLKALHEHQLLPRVISGSSAGSIVAALVGVRTDEELGDLFVTNSIDLTFFPREGSLRRKLIRLLTKGHLMEVEVLKQALEKNLDNVTFYEAYERTGRILNITVSPANDYERPRLLNYLTSPNVLIWSAACASCAFPILFGAVELVAKNDDGELVPYHLTNVKWKDGSLQADLPITRLSELFNVNHFIVSQTNPHAIPFMSKPRRVRKQREHKTTESPSLLRRCASVARYLVTSELAHRFKQAVSMGLVPKILEATLFQRLSGDITIVPPLSLSMYTNIISNPTWETIQQFMADAQRCTWPSISMIRNHCQIEMELDRIARELAKEAQRRAAVASDTAEERLDGLAGLYGDAAIYMDKGKDEDMAASRGLPSRDHLSWSSIALGGLPGGSDWPAGAGGGTVPHLQEPLSRVSGTRHTSLGLNLTRTQPEGGLLDGRGEHSGVALHPLLASRRSAQAGLNRTVEALSLSRGPDGDGGLREETLRRAPSEHEGDAQDTGSRASGPGGPTWWGSWGAGVGTRSHSAMRGN